MIERYHVLLPTCSTTPSTRARCLTTRHVRDRYWDQVSRTFHLANLRVVQSQQDSLTMRTSAFPSAECIADREQLPFWLGPVLPAVGGLEDRTGKWIFTQDGGFAGANLFQNFVAFALAGDWTLGPISGVVGPEAITCSFSDGWQCALDANGGSGAPCGTGPHELGHVFGLHHPDDCGRMAS